MYDDKIVAETESYWAKEQLAKLEDALSRDIIIKYDYEYTITYTKTNEVHTVKTYVRDTSQNFTEIIESIIAKYGEEAIQDLTINRMPGCKIARGEKKQID